MVESSGGEMKDLCFRKIDLLGEIGDENLRQLDKGGIQDHEPFEWLGFATEELGETAKAIGEWSYRGGAARDVVKEAIQTATLMLKIAEMFIDISENGDGR